MSMHLAPNLRTNKSTQSIMLDVIIALAPALIASIIFFGTDALILTLASVVTCIAAEFIFQKITKREVTIGDLSAVVTGILLSFNMTSTTPVWVVVLASVFSIVVVKQAFGGIGFNVVNPALAGRLFVMVLYPSQLMQYVTPFDGVSSATVLSGGSFDVMDMFIGKIPGALGETSALLLLVGFAYLVYRKQVNVIAPAVYIAVVVVMAAVFGGDIMSNLFGGGLMLGALFMLTDYNFVSKKGNILNAVVAGVITAAIRIWGAYPEGVCFGILAANCLSGLVSRLERHHVYGVEK